MRSDFSGVFLSLRKEHGLSQRQVAEELGISQALLSHYENGLREPKLSFVVKVCDYYGVSADYLLGRTGPETRDAAAAALESVKKEIENLRSMENELTELNTRLFGGSAGTGRN